MSLAFFQQLSLVRIKSSVFSAGTELSGGAALHCPATPFESTVTQRLPKLASRLDRSASCSCVPAILVRVVPRFAPFSNWFRKVVGGLKALSDF